MDKVSKAACFSRLKICVMVYCSCSKDCVNWGLLSPATAENITKARMMTGRFTGDPSYECEHRSETEDDVVVKKFISYSFVAVNSCSV